MTIIKKFPKLSGNIWQSIGPSIVSLGLGLGSGEFILWPYLVAHYGFGILWGALLGITMQLFIILEIQRYTIVKGEDLVTGFSRISRPLPFIITIFAIIGFGWPGFAASSSLLLQKIFNIPTDYSTLVSISILAFCAGVLLVGKKVYEQLESVLKYTVVLSFLFLFFLFIKYFDLEIFRQTLLGIIGQGTNFTFIPKGLNIAIFLGAIAYAGTGGILILSQSFYTIEEHHGLAMYARKFILWAKDNHSEKQDIIAQEDDESLKNFSEIRKLHIFEGTFLFWLLGFLTILLLSYLAHVLLSGKVNLPEGLSFIILESNVLGGLNGIVFLLIGAVALITVQLGVYDITGRITGIAVDLLFPQKKFDHTKVYIYAILIQFALGIMVYLFGVREPLWLLVSGAVINAFTMAAIAVGTVYLNTKYLPKRYRPSRLIQFVLLSSAVFYIVMLVIMILVK